jgi:hypothetical protein
MAGVSDITGYQTFGPFSDFGGYAGSSSTTSGVGGVGAYHHHHQNQAGDVPQTGSESNPPTNEASDLLKLLGSSRQTSTTAQANLNGASGQILDVFA